MPVSPITRGVLLRNLTTALLGSTLLLSACGSISPATPSPTAAPAAQAAAGGGGGGGIGPGGGQGQRQGAGQGPRAGGGNGPGGGAGGPGQGQRQAQAQAGGQGETPATSQSAEQGDGANRQPGDGRQAGGPRGAAAGGGPQASGTPNPQSPVLVGEVDIIDGHTVTVATNTGWRKVDVPDTATIMSEGRGTGADLTAGTSVGVTSKDGAASQVRIFPPNSTPRIGQFPMNGVQAGNTMTNAKIVSFDGSLLSLDYNGEKASITVPAEAVIIKPIMGTLADIALGARVTAAGTVNGDTLTARSVTILSNGSQQAGGPNGGPNGGQRAGGPPGGRGAAAAGTRP